MGSVTQVVQSVRRIAVAIYALASITLGFMIEGLLIAPIVFCARAFGFWLGMLVFTISWLLIGLAVLAVTVYFWRTTAEASTEELSTGPVRRRIRHLARRSRPLGAFAIALYFGPIMSPPFFRAIGYRDRRLCAWVAASALVFCPVWFTVYGGGTHLLLGLLRK